MSRDLGRLVLDALARRGRDWVLPPPRRPQLAARLEEAFSDPGLPGGELLRFLKLIAVLEEEPGYGGAAEEIVALLAEIPAAVAAFSRFLGRPSEADAARIGAHREAPLALMAPMVRPVDDMAQHLKLSDLFAPPDPIAMRARSASRMRSS